MNRAIDPRTSLSLLDRLRDDETAEVAWSEFLARYSRVLYRWCRRWGLQASDAEDVTQETLLAIARQIKHFRYDPGRSFRAWMKTIAYRSWIRVVEHSSRQVATGGSAAMEALASVVARDDLARSCEVQARQVLLEQALERARCRVSPVTWEAFRLTALEGHAGGEVARQLGLTIGDVYNARWRVQKFLRQEAEHLDPDL
jgi:RNA polymerase sigma-70 factor (ECF subfamily)